MSPAKPSCLPGATSVPTAPGKETESRNGAESLGRPRQLEFL